MKNVIDNIGYTKVPDIEGAIKFENLQWSEGKASVVVIKTISDNLKIEYEVVGSDGTTKVEYTEIASGEEITNLNHGDIVIARLTDGKTSGSSATINIKDEEPPLVDVTKEKVTSSSIQVNVTAKDNETGIVDNPSYKYYIKESTANEYPEEPIVTNSPNNTFSKLNPNTSYDVKIEIDDKAGNTGNGEYTNIITGNVPTIQYTPNESGTYRKSQSTKITVSEGAEEVKSIKYQWLSTTSTPSESSFTTTCTIEQTLSKSGVTGRWYLWTLLELETGEKYISRSGAFYLDNQGPTVTLTSTPVSTTSFTLNATASDSHVGTISSYKFYVNGTLKSTQTTSSRTAKYTVTGAEMGDAMCYVIVTDSLGNSTTKYATANTKMYTWEKWDAITPTEYSIVEGATVGYTCGAGYEYDIYKGGQLSCNSEGVVHINGTRKNNVPAYDLRIGDYIIKESSSNYNYSNYRKVVGKSGESFDAFCRISYQDISASKIPYKRHNKPWHSNLNLKKHLPRRWSITETTGMYTKGYNNKIKRGEI